MARGGASATGGGATVVAPSMAASHPWPRGGSSPDVIDLDCSSASGEAGEATPLSDGAGDGAESDTSGASDAEGEEARPTPRTEITRVRPGPGVSARFAWLDRPPPPRAREGICAANGVSSHLQL